MYLPALVRLDFLVEHTHAFSGSCGTSVYVTCGKPGTCVSETHAEEVIHV